MHRSSALLLCLLGDNVVRPFEYLRARGLFSRWLPWESSLGRELRGEGCVHSSGNTGAVTPYSETQRFLQDLSQEDLDAFSEFRSR